MIERIEKIVQKNPNRIAYKVNGESITYKKLWSRACEYAQLLKRQGTSPVIIYGNKDINVIVSILSCVLANRTYVPIGLCTPKYRMEKIIEITKASLILTDCILKIDKIECCKLEDLIQYEQNEIKISNSENIYIIFTSGSTGIPKGVPISKSNLNNFINWISNLVVLSDYKNINVLNQASFSFDLSVADLYYSLCNGHTLIAFDGNIQDDFDKLFDIMRDINVAVMTPTFMKICMLNSEFNEKKYPKLKCIYFCGEQLEAKVVQKIFKLFPKLKIINAYGPTEATSAISAIPITPDMVSESKLLPVGDMRALATQVEIINDEIVLKGASVFNGYLDDSIQGHYKENGINCYKTGDIGYIENNKLYCRGRKDNQIKYKGYRIELGDIEYNINLIKGVKECAVIAKHNDDLVVKTIIAFVVLEQGIDTKYVKEKLKKYLPEYMIPRTIKSIDKLPINENGKVDRKALSEL